MHSLLPTNLPCNHRNGLNDAHGVGPDLRTKSAGVITSIITPPLTPLLHPLPTEPLPARHHPLRPHVHKQPEKTTRVRTVLNEKQLHTLRTCYAANPRPDALMKEQLVEMTSLSPRVIRVWFQNKRCKDKKRSILIKQMQQQGGDKTVRELNFDGDNNCQIVNNNNLTE